MLITWVRLENAKSYRNQKVDFAPGTNAICGENGAGKTTLLEAIGFTLFDFLPGNQSSFVREGEKTAAITVRFTSSHDEREYDVVRRCGGSSDYYVHDPELKAKLVFGKADVVAWLRQHLGVEAGADLTALFHDALGVPQGLLTAPFLEKPSLRKPIFDRLLHVEEYNRAWEELRETISTVKDQSARGQALIAGLDAMVGRLPELRRSTRTLGAELRELQKRQASLAAELAGVTKKRQEMDVVAQNLAALKQDVDRWAATLASLEARLVTARDAEALSEKARAEMDSAKPGHDAYLAAQRAIAGLEGQRAEMDKLSARRAAQETVLARAQERREQTEKLVRDAAQAEGQLAALAPQVAQQVAGEARRDQLRQDVLAHKQLGKQRSDLVREVEALDKELERMAQGLAQAGAQEATVRTGEDTLERLREAYHKTELDMAASKAEHERLVLQQKALSRTETAVCPTCEQSLPAGQRTRLLNENVARQNALQQQIARQERELQKAKKEGLDLRAAVDAAKKRLQELPRQGDLETQRARRGTLADRMAALDAEIGRLAGAVQELAQVEGELATLADPRRRHDLLAAQAAKAAGLKAALESEKATVSNVEATLKTIAEDLLPFADLAERIHEQRQVSSANQSAYQSYLENSRIAAMLTQRQGDVTNLSVEMEKAQAQLGDTRSRLEEAAAGFDPAALEGLRQQEAALGREQATAEGQMLTLARQRQGAVDEIATLEQKQVELAEERRRQADRQLLLTRVQVLRDAIRDAGPHVIRRVSEQVSLKASHLFAAIFADPACRLHWTSDYGIHMEKDGRTRAFEMLSGGEQMAAALSIRLALLRQLSAIDVAFFDEPTSNLDEIRRENLAEQIVAIKNTGFSQVFVISHDDTFEQATDHVVRVFKRDGESQVEEG